MKAQKPCEWCQRPFAPREARIRFCRRRCVDKWKSKQMEGHRWPMAEARNQQRLDRVKRDLGAEFGELSIREIQLFKWTWRTAYQHGYNKAYRPKAHDAASMAPTRAELSGIERSPTHEATT
jgi:hypothetical protein